MRALAMLLIAAAATACAHRLPQRDLRAEARDAVREQLRREEVCLPVGFSDERIEGAFAVEGQRQPDGSYGFDRSRLMRFDAFAGAGLLTREETRQGSGASAAPLLLYRMTALGRHHFRGPELGAGAARSQPRFCYGSAIPVQERQIDWTDDGGCEETLYVSVLFTFSGIPDWAEVPALREAFPQWLGRADEDVVRFRRYRFVRRDGRWDGDAPPGGLDICHDRRRPITRSLPA